MAENLRALGAYTDVWQKDLNTLERQHLLDLRDTYRGEARWDRLVNDIIAGKHDHDPIIQKMKVLAMWRALS